jgi:hypothetical protein
MLCPQLKQNLENIKTLKSELDLNLVGLEDVFKVFKNNNPSTSLRVFDSKIRKERMVLVKKIKKSVREVDSNIQTIYNKLKPLRLKKFLDSHPRSEKFEMTLGQRSKQEIVEELDRLNSAHLDNFARSLSFSSEGLYVSKEAREFVASPKFEVGEKPERLRLIRLGIKDLGLHDGATIKEIYQKADGLGLELCPLEIGPNLALNSVSVWSSSSKSLGSRLLKVATKPIDYVDDDGLLHSGLFSLFPRTSLNMQSCGCDASGKDVHKFYGNDQFVFRIPSDYSGLNWDEDTSPVNFLGVRV